MTPDDAARAVRQCFPDTADPVVTAAGEGDYCHAFAVAPDWIFLFAKTGEASASLQRVRRLTPRLAPALSVPIPTVEHVGRFGVADRLFVGYRRVDGSPLDARSGRASLDRTAGGLATFIRRLHAFDVDAAVAAGVPACEYAFAATEEGLRTGSAEAEHRADLERLERHGVPRTTIRALEQALAAHLDAVRSDRPPAVLLHGELSCEHVLTGDDGELTGVIDLNGMTVGDPARDLLYLDEELGRPFVEVVLDAVGADEPPAVVLERLGFLRLWHAALRALWLLGHGYAERARLRLAEVGALLHA